MIFFWPNYYVFCLLICTNRNQTQINSPTVIHFHQKPNSKVIQIMINYVIRINNVRNPNSRLCYWHDTHFHIEIIFQTIFVIILAISSTGAVSNMIAVTINIHGLKVLLTFVPAGVCQGVWMWKFLVCRSLVVSCISFQKISCEDCMWIW